MTNSPAQESLVQFSKALDKLVNVFLRPLEDDDIVLDAAIQRFEFSFELCWKTLQKFLAQEGFVVASPKQALQKAYALGWIANEDLWLEMLEDRNITSHTYHEEKALQIHRHLKVYLPLLQQLRQFLQSKK